MNELKKKLHTYIRNKVDSKMSINPHTLMAIEVIKVLRLERN